MAFNLSKIEAVKFGDFEVVPKMDREQRLRVQALKVTEENIDEVQEVLAASFGADASRVKEFMEKNMFLMDYVRLQVYLTQGDKGLSDLEKRMDKIADKQIDDYLEKMKNE